MTTDNQDIAGSELRRMIERMIIENRAYGADYIDASDQPSLADDIEALVAQREAAAIQAFGEKLELARLSGKIEAYKSCRKIMYASPNMSRDEVMSIIAEIMHDLRYRKGEITAIQEELGK